MWGTSALYKNRRLGRLPPRALTLRTNAANFFALGFGDLSALALRSSAWSNGKAPPVFAIPISVFFFFCCIFFPPLPSSFPLPLCPSAPRTVSSRGEKKPGMNGNQPRRPLAVSPPRKTGRRQELSVPLSCVPWGWDLTEIPSSPPPRPAAQCPLLQPKEQTQRQEISELGQGWEEDCMCSSPGEQTGVRPAHDNRINH